MGLAATGCERALAYVGFGAKRFWRARALSADGNPSFATVLKVARALGVRLHVQAA